MNCYFCQQPLKLEKSRSNNFHNSYESCENCIKHHDLLDVYTVLDDHQELLFAQIYVGHNYKVITIPGPGSLSFCSSHFELGRKYQIRLHLKQYYTNICETTGDDIKQLLQIPGFPINPANAKEKLKLYLLFS